MNQELETTQARIKELKDQGSLTFVEAEELTKLERQNALLERQNALNREALRISIEKAEREFATNFPVIDK